MVVGTGLENTALRVLSCLLFMVLYHDTEKDLASANDIASAWEKPLTRTKKRRLSRTGKRRFHVQAFVLRGRQDIEMTLAGVVGNFR
jgi:hypothetical protein